MAKKGKLNGTNGNSDYPGNTYDVENTRLAYYVQKGLLYIDVPSEQLSVPMQAGIVDVVTPRGPGHDPCLTCLQLQSPAAGGEEEPA